MNHPMIVSQLIQERYREVHRSARQAPHSSAERAHRESSTTGSSARKVVRQVAARLGR
jgi:hypothetical protein